MSAPRIGSLFAGYGGLSLAVESIFGGQLAWYADCCKFDKGGNAGHHEPHRSPCSIMEHRWPGVPNLGDVTAVDWSTVPPIDILDGGSPCQDLSHAGRRAGMTEGTRSNLWVAMREAIAHLRPSVVVWENVRGAYSAGADSGLESCAGCVGDVSLRTEPVLRALGRVLGDLSDLGYDTRWHGLRAADVGAPHGRFRVFVVATDTQGNAGRLGYGDGSATADAGLLRGRAGWESAPGEAPRGWAQPLPGLGRGVGADRPDLTLLPTPAVNDMGDRPWANPETWDAWTEKHRGRGINGNGHGKSLAIEAQRLLPTPAVADTQGGRKGRSGDRSDELLLNGIAAADRWGDYAAAIARWEHALGRPAPAPTQTSTKGNPQLSPAFVEWMMGLPSGWVTNIPGITHNEALKALGNGVVPQQATAALLEMLSWEVAA